MNVKAVFIKLITLGIAAHALISDFALKMKNKRTLDYIPYTNRWSCMCVCALVFGGRADIHSSFYMYLIYFKVSKLYTYILFMCLYILHTKFNYACISIYVCTVPNKFLICVSLVPSCCCNCLICVLALASSTAHLVCWVPTALSWSAKKMFSNWYFLGFMQL